MKIENIDTASLSFDDLAFLIGHSDIENVKIEAENAWLNEANADANPYNQKINEWQYDVWRSRWKECNKYC